MTTGAKDGRSGGSFSSPARPDNFTPDEDGGGFSQGTGPAASNGSFGGTDGDVKPVNTDYNVRSNVYSFPSAIAIDSDSDGDAF